MLSTGGINQLLFEFHWNPATNAMNKRYDVILKRYKCIEKLYKTEAISICSMFIHFSCAQYIDLRY